MLWRSLQIFSGGCKLTLRHCLRSMNTLSDGKKVAVVLHGCGVYDGSEIHEATSMLIHLSKAGAKVSIFAPNINQSSVVDHSTGSRVSEKRNVLVESARISRGKINRIEELQPVNFDALFIPGGFGAATTLSNFASAGASCKVLPEVERVLKGFSHAKKPIGLCCIAPVLAARCLPGVHVTTGTDPDTAAAINLMGAIHENREITDICVDDKFKVVTAPAYMCSTATISDIYDNVGLLVKSVLSLID